MDEPDDDVIQTDPDLDARRPGESREVEPHDADAVVDAADEADRLEHHRRGFADGAAINPRRSQESSGRPADRG